MKKFSFEAYRKAQWNSLKTHNCQVASAAVDATLLTSLRINVSFYQLLFTFILTASHKTQSLDLYFCLPLQVNYTTWPLAGRHLQPGNGIFTQGAPAEQTLRHVCWRGRVGNHWMLSVVKWLLCSKTKSWLRLSLSCYVMFLWFCFTSE